MISGFRIDFEKSEKSRLFQDYEYVRDIPFFKTTSSFNFSPGINIVLGPNGCGKSSLLKILASYMAAIQGGHSVVTETWLNSLKDSTGKYSVDHDGQPILFCDTNVDVGLIGGQAAFDDEFMFEGIGAIQRKASSGLTRISRMSRLLNALIKNEGFPKNIEVRKSGHRLLEVPEILHPTIPLGPRTVIVDEPESALTFNAQRNIIQKCIAGARENGCQLIMATHSPFILPYLKDEDVTLHDMSVDKSFVLLAYLDFIELGKEIQSNLFKKQPEK